MGGAADVATNKRMRARNVLKAVGPQGGFRSLSYEYVNEQGTVVHASTAKGSVVAFDYMTTEPLESKALYWRYARMGTKAAGEPLKFGIDSMPPSRERLAEFLQSCGLSLGEQRMLGEETNGKRAWGGFAIAIVK